MCGNGGLNVILGRGEAGCGHRIGVISRRCQRSGGVEVGLCKDGDMRLLDQELAQ